MNVMDRAKHVVLRLGVRVFDEAKLAAHVAGRDVDTSSLSSQVIEALVAEGPVAPVDFGCEVSQVHCALSAADLSFAPAGVIGDGIGLISRWLRQQVDTEVMEPEYEAAVFECVHVLRQVEVAMAANHVPPQRVTKAPTESVWPRLSPTAFMREVHALLRPEGDPDDEVSGADFIQEVTDLLERAGHPQNLPWPGDDDGTGLDSRGFDADGNRREYL